MVWTEATHWTVQHFPRWAPNRLEEYCCIMWFGFFWIHTLSVFSQAVTSFPILMICEPCAKFRNHDFSGHTDCASLCNWNGSAAEFCTVIEEEWDWTLCIRHMLMSALIYCRHASGTTSCKYQTNSGWRHIFTMANSMANVTHVSSWICGCADERVSLPSSVHQPACRSCEFNWGKPFHNKRVELGNISSYV